MTPSRKRPLFPLIRHMSGPVTAVLVRFPVSANQITTASLVSGLAASWYLVEGKFDAVVTAAVLLLVSYVLDYCDGEIARIKGQCSEFGDKFDTFVDWIVHTAFFVALGIGATRSFGANVWFWLGVIAGIGGTINYFIGIMLDARGKAVPETAKPGTHLPESARDRMLYAFRELTRWDFCFIILVLAVFDLAWVLLPVGAIGAQIYWITQFARGAHDFHTLEHFPPGLNRSDRAISGRGQESAAERSGTTVKGLDAASARNGSVRAIQSGWKVL